MTWKHFSMEQAAARFDNSQDFTIGIEEEFQIIDAESLELENRFEELYAIARPRMGVHVSGELIASEIEINTRKGLQLREVEADLKLKRTELAGAAQEAGLALAACGTHPFSDWRKQRILDTTHYRDIEERLKYLAWKNLAYGMHVHVGVRGHERMISIFNAIRGYLPHVLALSANSPFAENHYTYLHSTRAQIFTRSFPRCNIPGEFNGWQDYASYVNMLFDTHSISDPMQIWWSVRPHPWFGTLEIRICDCQSDLECTMAIASLIVALVSQLAEDYDAGKVLPSQNNNQLEENLWRATRYGLSGSMIDFEAGKEVNTPDSIRKLIDYAGDQWARVRASQYLEKTYQILKEGNGAQNQIRKYENSQNVRSVFADLVANSRFDYSEA